MKRSIPAVIAALFFTTPDQAAACSSTEEVMAHFETVKNAYVAKAPNMTPEQFPIWTGHLERFGDAMGRSDFAGACAVLDALVDRQDGHEAGAGQASVVVGACQVAQHG